MKRNIVIISFIVFVLGFACTKDATIIHKSHPVVETLQPTDINPDGATFHGQFISSGVSDIIEYGFVYSANDPTLETSDYVVVADMKDKDSFIGSVTDGLAGNINYNVKAYAKTDTRIVYGNSVEFMSQGSITNPWEMILQFSMFGSSGVKGFSGDGMGFILFKSGHLYAFDPSTNSISEKERSPVEYLLGGFTLGKDLYMISNRSDSIIKYNIDRNSWTTIIERPFRANEYSGTYGFVIDDIGYFITSGKMSAYNNEESSWIEKHPVPSSGINAIEVLNGRAYLFGDDKEIWSYNPVMDYWHKVTVFPGEKNGKMISFVQNNRLFFGISNTWDSGYELWEYNTNENSWGEIEAFPKYHSQFEEFHFSIDSFSYYGYCDRNNYYKHSLYRFDSRRVDF